MAVYLLLHSPLQISLCQVTHFYQSSFYYVQESDAFFLISPNSSLAFLFKVLASASNFDSKNSVLLSCSYWEYDFLFPKKLNTFCSAHQCLMFSFSCRFTFLRLSFCSIFVGFFCKFMSFTFTRASAKEVLYRDLNDFFAWLLLLLSLQLASQYFACTAVPWDYLIDLSEPFLVSFHFVTSCISLEMKNELSSGGLNKLWSLV